MKKNYLKTNLISFITGVLIFSCIGVYAIVNFSSNDVTYDNKESGLSSTNVKGAIDELYIECTKEPTAGETIIENAGLEKDPYECRYFFTGANPNNYITFNNETWRIISVECDGRIKIMRIDIIANIVWDETNSNNWARPATLNTYLNETYYNSLNSIAKSQIVASNFSIGGDTWDNNNMSTQVSNENSNKWYGNIALPTLSEYIRTNSNKSKCGTVSLINDNYSSCVSTGWMDNNDIWRVLTPYSGNSNSVFYINSYGNINYMRVYDSQDAVRPVVYLSSEVKITGGNGTQSNPYTIE